MFTTPIELQPIARILYNEIDYISSMNLDEPDCIISVNLQGRFSSFAAPLTISWLSSFFVDTMSSLCKSDKIQLQNLAQPNIFGFILPTYHILDV